MKFIDLFCGIGGFRLSFEKYNNTCVFSSDIDFNVCNTYKDNFGDYPLSDIREINEEQIPDFDILCAGFPCQPFSIGGLRKGFSDNRGTLFFEIERIIRAKRPKAFILENVKGLVNHDKGKTLEVILNTLGSSINGSNNAKAFENCLNYNVFFKVINSNEFGVPQNRERIYIVGFLDSSIDFKFPKGDFKNKVSLKSFLELDTKSNISEVCRNNILNNLEKHKKYKVIKDNELLLAYEIRKSRCTFRFDGIAPTLTAKMGTGGNNVPVLVKYMRKLSTRECLKIQGFPDSYVIKDNSSHSYKQIGNSVAVPVVSAIAENMMKYLKK